MSPPLEHDYIGLSDASSTVDDGGGARPALYLKQTELRLGLPGSESPDRNPIGLTLDLLPPKTATFVSGAKRGFSDAIDEAGKWAFSGTNRSDADQGKAGVLFSPRGDGGGPHSGTAGGVVGDSGQEKKAQIASAGVAPAAKEQVVGWPPIRSYRRNSMTSNPAKNKDDTEVKQGAGCLYVKVSMDGAPYLRKVDLKMYCNYKELSSALQKMFSGFTIGQCGGQGIPSRDGLSESRLMDLLNGSEYVLTYEDKDGDWMLVGDVPWEMFADSCRRLRIMKGSDAIGLAPRAMEKCKNRN